MFFFNFRFSYLTIFSHIDMEKSFSEICIWRISGEDEAEDSCEDLGAEHPASDVEVDEPVVDTDAPSHDSSGNSLKLK